MAVPAKIVVTNLTVNSPVSQLQRSVKSRSPSMTSSRTAIKWVVETLLDKTVLTVENWLEVAYHLCKQRWDSSVDWLESQPMSKITAMIDIVKRHAEEQEAQMKKASRKKK
jgi:hypothetical protein